MPEGSCTEEGNSSTITFQQPYIDEGTRETVFREVQITIPFSQPEYKSILGLKGVAERIRAATLEARTSSSCLARTYIENYGSCDIPHASALQRPRIEVLDGLNRILKTNNELTCMNIDTLEQGGFSDETMVSVFELADGIDAFLVETGHLQPPDKRHNKPLDQDPLP